MLTVEQQDILTKHRAKVLWCVHVLGPDELHAMPDYATAEKNVADLIAALYTPRTAGLDVLCLPIVAPWPWTAEAHREELKKRAWEPAEHSSGDTGAKS